MNIGTEIEGYRITGVLGHGGMGIVYAAEDVALGLKVALKMIDPGFARDEHFVRRFRAEARALARIKEPHIVQVYGLRQTDAGTFIVMEYVEGDTLADRLARGPVPVAEAVPLIRQMLQAFVHAHELGVVHRDIKPGNIMLVRDGMVKVIDFGLARVQQSQAAVTVTQAIAGTLYYMSPEQVRGASDVDHRSDLYSLGMTIYEMLAGRLPIERQQGEFETMRAIVEDDFPPPTRFNAAIPPPLSRIVQKAIAKDPDKRYQHAADMLADLDAFTERSAGTVDSTMPITGTYARRPEARIRRLAAFAGAGVGVLLLIAGAIWLMNRNDAAGTDTVTPETVVPVAILQVTSSPDGATVLIDGRDAGTTPVTEEVAADGRGVHLQLEMDGFQTLDTLVYPADGETMPVALALEASADDSPAADDTPSPGTLAVNLIGDGVVRVGNRLFDRAGRVTLPPGDHTIRCGDAPLDLTARVTIAAGRERSVTCHFEARITLNTQMEDGSLAPSASIWIDGADTGLFTPTEIVRGVGTYRISVRKFGYEVLDEEEVTIRPSLEPQTPRRLVFRLRQTA